ncbi:MAG: ABC transporter substrate-binding protein [Oscillospiraceae bacterium]|nr:ABC transporter substrate-binding protein [Oscillospiraceae bacterium]
MKKIVSLILVALLMLGALTACAANDKATEGKVIKLGAVLPLSGASAESGKACQQGLELAVAEINEAGGLTLNGEKYQLELYCEDDTGSPDQSVSVATKLIEMDEVSVVYCSCLSSCALAIMDICDQYPDVLFTTIECTSDNFKKIISEDPDRYANFYKPYYNSSDYGAAFGELVADLSEKGIIDFSNKTVAYIVEDTDAGRSCVTACEEALDKFCGGSTTVATEVITQGATDFYSQINKFKALDPDVVMTFFVPLNSGVAYIKQVDEIGADWVDVAFVYPLKAGFVEQTGTACEGLFWLPMQVDFWNNADCAAFAEKVYAMFPDAGLNAMHLSSYLGVYMIVEAIETAGTTSAQEGLANAYATMEFKTINGTYVFNDDHTAIAGPDNLVISAAQVQGGKYYVVWPENIAYADAVPQN